MSEVQKKDPRKVITGLVRFSYANVFAPVSINGSDAKYSVALLIPKSDTATVKKIHAAVEAAKLEGKKKWDGKIPKELKLPLRDGDGKDNDEGDVYKGHWYINANAKTKPNVVDANLTPIIDQDEFYSGCYGRASITFYGFNTNGNKGIAAGLNHVQKLKDGDHLGGRASVESDFDEELKIDTSSMLD